jgi:hypothetical protein
MKTLTVFLKFQTTTQTLLLLILFSLFSNTSSLALTNKIKLPPNAPSTPVLDTTDDTGSSNSDNVTNLSSDLTLSGTSDPDVTITILLEGVPTAYTTTADGDGNWTLDISLTEGTHNITAVANDGVDDSDPSGVLTITVDLTDPASPTSPDLSSDDDSGASNTDNITNVTSNLTISGTAEGNATIELFNGINLLGTTVASAGGAWTIDLNLTEGSYSITAIAIDISGNTSPASSALALTIDTTPPNIPGTPDLAAADDSGISNTDNITNITSNLTFSGTADPGISIQLFNGASPIGTPTTASGGGTWSIDLNLAEGNHAISARATDAAGNFSNSTPLNVNVDTTPPTVVVGGYSPTGSGAATNTSFSITFNENVAISNTSASGSEDDFRVFRNMGDLLRITVARGSGDISILGSQVTVINSGTELPDLNRLHYVLIGDKVFSDIAGNNYAGISNPSTWTFTTSAGAIVTAPTIGACATTFATLGDIVITETGNNNINGADNSFRTLVLSLTDSDYRFNTSATVTALPASDGDIVAITTTSITSTRITFTINFDGSSKNESDVITISGIQITSGGSTSAATIVKHASSTLAIQGITDGVTPLANATIPVQTVTPANLSFIVQNVDGTDIGDGTQSSFSTSSNAVKLVGRAFGSPVDGVFSGNGVVLTTGSPSDFYTFNPSTVGVSSNIPITFTYTPPGECPVSITRNFQVFSSNIAGLSATYCSNGSSSSISVPTDFLNDNYPLWSSYVFMYYDPDIFDFVEYGPSCNSGSCTAIFDPQASIHEKAINIYGSAIISFKVKNSGGVEIGSYWNQYVFIPIYNPPPVSFIIPQTSFCDYGAEVAVSGNPAPALTDVFSGQGIDNPSRTFDPKEVTTKGSPITLSYTYTNPSTGCSNTATQEVTVYARPQLVDHTDLYLYTANVQAGVPATTYSCQNESFDYIVTALNGTPVYPDDYKFNWYSNAGLTNQMYTQSWFFYPYTVDTGTPGSTSFFVTQVENGCESLGREIFGVVNQAAVVDAGPANVTICSTDDLIFTTLNPTVAGSASVSQSYWTTSGDGEFIDAGNNAIVGTAFFSVASRYRPGPNDRLNQSVILTLFSNDPDGPSQPCRQVSDAITVNITPSPTAVAGNDAVYCADGAIFLSGFVEGANAQTTVTWTVLPAGGTIVSPGSLTTEFIPSLSQKNNGATLVFSLTTNDPDGPGPCTASTDNVTIEINQEATIDAGPDNAFCADETIILTGTKPIGSGAQSWTWSGGLGSFNNPNSLTTEYNYHPSEVGQSIIFTLTSDDPDGSGPCLSRSDQVAIRIKVAPEPPVIAPAFRYCVTPGIAGATEPLSASGPGVRWYNNPDLTGIPSANPFSTGITTLTDSRTTFYATALQEGCESSATPTTIIVNPAPYPSFEVQNFCLGDGTEFTNTTPALVYNNGGSGTIVSWSYDFGNGIVTPMGTGPLPVGTNSTTGTHENPVHQYANTGLYNPVLTAVTSDGCMNSASVLSLTGSQIRIGDVPIAAFNYLNVCEEDITQFDYLENVNPAKDDMKIFTWEFDDPASGVNNTSTASDPSHQFNQFGTYNVKLTLVSNLDCVDEVIRPVYILPYLKEETDFPYISSFEDSNHGWGHEGLALDFRTNSIHNSWNLVNPSGPTINSAYDGSFAWITNDGGAYQNNERSVLYGPCVDLNKLPKPALSFAYWSDVEPGGDGVYVEISTNNGITWTPLDPIGLRWYNGASISGLTSQPNVVDNSNGGTIGQSLNQYGFTGITSGWTTGKHSLDAFANQSKLRIRFVFGSNGDNPPGSSFEGFAMDYFKLDSREKIILAENFTNSNELANNSAFNSFKQSVTNSEVIKIQYHTNLKGPDELNSENPADPNARVAFYGITTSSNLVPRAYLDGYSNGDYTLPWVNDYYSIRSLEDAPFEITPSTFDTEPGTLEISASIKALLTIPETERPVVRIAIVEKTVDDNQYVLRKFLPSAAGYPLTPPNTTILPDQTFQLPNFSWTVSNSDIDQTNLAVIIFIQDQNNNNEGFKQVYQAAIITNPNIIPAVVTSIEDPTFFDGISIYPNPANREVNVVLPEQTPTPIALNLIDAQGRTVHTNGFATGEQQKTIDTSELAPGLYIIQFNTGQGVVRKKVMVVHEK